MAVLWEGQLDPAEKLDFEADFGGGEKPVLEEDETIASYSLAVTAEAAALGLQIESAPPYASSLVAGSKAVKLWLSVDPLEQENSLFTAGVQLGIEVTIVTSSSPARTRQRTWNVEVKQQ